MWNDIETITDYLHFSVVSKTVADLIIESGDNPISIGGLEALMECRECT